MFAFSTSVFAQSEEKKSETGILGPELSALNVGMQLAKYGYQTKSATTLCEAARILSSVKEQPLGVTKEVETSGKQGDGQKSSIVQYDPKQILAYAEELAGKDKNVLDLIKDVRTQMENSSSRGAVGGPKGTYDRVEAYDTDIYHVRFYGGESASVIVDGDGDTDLDLYIYDENGNLIDSDDDSSDYCYCSWKPKWTGTFKIKIKNRGGVYNRYSLKTN